MECFLCENNEDLLVKKYKYWTIFIHSNQCYLGRCLIRLNRHIVDFCDTTEKERVELFEIIKKLRNVIKSSFKPDLFNYASLGNTINHLHIHFIPRYKDKRLFENIEFTDKNWGHNFAPHGEQKLPQPILDKLIEKIKQKL